jgi:hypothetical protein
VAKAEAKAMAKAEAEAMLTIKLGLHNKSLVFHSAEGFFRALGCTGQLGPHRPAWLHILLTTVKSASIETQVEQLNTMG